MISHCHDITEILLKLVLKEAGQIGPKPNRPQVKSAPFLLFTIVNMQSEIVWTLFSKIFKYIQYVLIIEELKLSSKGLTI